MTLKSYFSGTVEAAVEQARHELGPDAMLVDSRKAAPETRHLGEYEVVFASMPSICPADSSGGAGPSPRPMAEAVPAGASAALRAELADIKRHVSEIRRTIRVTGLAPASALPHTAVRARVLSILAAAEVEPELAHEVSACVEARLYGDPLVSPPPAGGVPDGDQEQRLERALVAELEGRFTTDAALGRHGAEARVAALVGPPGSGKTTTLAKLAVACGLKRRRRVHLVSMDTYRIAADEQLRTYAAILGTGFETIEAARALDQSLKLHRDKGLVLIDTPGFGVRDMDGAADLAGILAARADVDVHLVLPASMKPADLSLVVDRFEIFRPSKLLFTRIDETSSFGPVLSEAARTSKPVSFLTSGQSVPEDLEAADRGTIIARILTVAPAVPAAAL